jgi:tRNA(Leu) C34 or U34 (ribose-2'-O)-methylase TrmL
MSSGVILLNPKYPHNVAAAIRACSCFGVNQLVWDGWRVNPEEYSRLPREERMKGYKEVRWYHSAKPFDEFHSAVPVCVEITESAQPLPGFKHPENAVYVFGPEDGGVSQVARRLCHAFVFIPAYHCLNLAAALNVVLYDRASKTWESKAMASVLKEVRGEIAQPGWEGQ